MPEDQNIIVTSLPEYVEQNRDQLIRRVVLGGNTIRHMVPQTGIKTKAKINYLDVDPEFQDGAGCGFHAQDGGIAPTQRETETGTIKVELTVCPDKLLGKYAEYLVKIGATEEDLPFEEYITAGIIDAINAKMEKAVWQGDTDSENPDLNKFDGLLKLAAAEADTVEVTFAASDSVWDKIKAVILAIPELALSKEKVSVFISAEDFRAFMLEMVEKNFYHYDGAHNSAPEEFAFPGTNVTVVKANGLNGTHVMYATFDRNLYYGCDLENNKEQVKIWYSDDDDIFKIKVKWNAGVQTAFPDQVVLATAAEGPKQVTITGATSVALGADAGSRNETFAASDGGAVLAAVPESAPWLATEVNGNIVTFTAQANAGAARSATVRISTASEGSAGYLDVTVSQAAPAGAPTISGAAAVSMANTAGSVNRTYSTSDGSAVLAEVSTPGADWLSVSVATGNKVTFTATAQAAAAEQRTAEVALTTATGGSKTVTVTQAAGE